VIEDGHTRECRTKLFQHLQPTAGQFRRRIGDSCNIAAGLAPACDGVRRHCVRADHDDWDRARRLPRRLDRLVSYGEHDVDSELYEFSREFLEPIGPPVGGPVLKGNVPRIPDEGLYDELSIGSDDPA